MSDKATLTLAGKNYDLDIRKGAVGPDVVNISSLYRDAGVFTFDPGFTSTASCESKITFIDGEEGILLYRGYPIEQLAEHGDFSAAARVRFGDHLPHHAARADVALLFRLPP